MPDRLASSSRGAIRSAVERLLYVVVVASLFVIAALGIAFLTSDKNYGRLFLTFAIFVLPRVHPRWNDDAGLVLGMICRDTILAFAVGFTAWFMIGMFALHRTLQVWDPLIASGIGAVLGYCSFRCACGFDIMLQLVAAAWKERHKHFRPW